jgi:hypothetical protein
VPPQCFAADFSFLTAPALTTTPPPSPQPRPPNRSGPYVFLDHWIHWVPLRDLLMLGGPEMGLQGQQICRPASFDDCFAASITLISTDDPHTFRARVLMPLQLTIVGFSTRQWKERASRSTDPVSGYYTTLFSEDDHDLPRNTRDRNSDGQSLNCSTQA